MSIKDSFVPYNELLDLFQVQRVNALERCLKQNEIKYLLDKNKRPPSVCVARLRSAFLHLHHNKKVRWVLAFRSRGPS